MRVSGFSFVRNGIRLAYPFEESILSVLPLVDEFVMNVGQGDDGTLERIRVLQTKHPKIKIIESTWDEKLRQEGKILAQQTDIALAACTGDWGLYIQADEVLHEDDYQRIRDSLARAQAREDVDGLLFRYEHFYGDFFVVNRNPVAYREEVRAIKLGRGIGSYRDAQGFRKGTDKLRVLESGARIFHYGWVRPPKTMEEKTRIMDRLYHEAENATGDNHRYKHIIGLERYRGTHPQVMQQKISEKDWTLDLLAEPMVFTAGDIRKFFSLLWERMTGRLPFAYRNFIRVR